MPARVNPEERMRTLTATFVGNNNAGTAPYSSTAARPVFEFRRTYTGSKTPGFSNPKLRPKPAPFRDYTLSAVKRDERLVRRYRSKPGPSGGWDEYYDTFAVMSNTNVDYTWYCDHSQAAYNAAVDKAMQRAKDMKVNIAQMFAERKQTVNLVYDHVTRIANAALSVRKGRLDLAARQLGTVFPPSKRELRKKALELDKSRAAYWQDRLADNLKGYGMFDSTRGGSHDITFRDKSRRKSKTLSQDWLALMYGWLPLLEDVKGAAETVARQALEGVRPFVRSKGKGLRGYPKAYYRSSTPIGDIEFEQTEYKSIAKVILEFEVYDSWSAGMSTIGIQDPLLLAWELLPWSFVVDWFLPVGKFLELMNYDDGLRFKRGMYSLNTECSWESRFLGSSSTDGANLTTTFSYGAPYASKCKNFWRRVYTVPPRPVWPSFKSPLSIVHAANALALLRTNFKVK